MHNGLKHVHRRHTHQSCDPPLWTGTGAVSSLYTGTRAKRLAAFARTRVQSSSTASSSSSSSSSSCPLSSLRAAIEAFRCADMCNPREWLWLQDTCDDDNAADDAFPDDTIDAAFTDDAATDVATTDDAATEDANAADTTDDEAEEEASSDPEPSSASDELAAPASVDGSALHERRYDGRYGGQCAKTCMCVGECVCLASLQYIACACIAHE